VTKLSSLEQIIKQPVTYWRYTKTFSHITGNIIYITENSSGFISLERRLCRPYASLCNKSRDIVIYTYIYAQSYVQPTFINMFSGV